MFKNYFTVAFRNMMRNKVFAIINIVGLAIGISASIVIFLIVRFHFSFDGFEPDRDRLFRIVSDMKFAGSAIHNRGVPTPLAQAVRAEVPGIEETTGFHEWNSDLVVSVPNNTKDGRSTFRNQDRIVLVDPPYFRMIPYQWIAGSPGSLSEPFKIVLSEERAKMYFPGLSPASVPGKIVYYNDTLALTVTGVVRSLEQHTDFTYQEFISQGTIVAGHMESYYSIGNWNSTNSGTQLFVKLNAGNSQAKTEAQLQKLFKKYVPDVYKDENNRSRLVLQPFGEIHFDAVYGPPQGSSAHKPTLYGLAAVAVFLLLLGCINFVNLSTAQATQRAKEIGVRKTLGSSRNQLVFQFLNETFLLATAATVLSLVLVPLLLKVFSGFIPAGLTFSLFGQPAIFGFLLLMIAAVGLLSGLYPAFVLSRFQPAVVLKNQAFSGGAHTRKTWLRKGLTISQFFVAQVFVMATLLMVKQIHFMINKDMGFKKEAILNVQTPVTWTPDGFSTTDKRRFVMLSKLKALTGISKISLGQGQPASNGFNSNLLTYNDGKKEIMVDVLQKSGDTNYLSLYHIKILAGRNGKLSDTTKEYLINETMMHMMGFQNPQDVINKQLSGKPVVGVIADYNQTSLHSQIKPLAFSVNTTSSWDFSIELASQQSGASGWKKTISDVEAIFKATYPTNDFQYAFFDENIAKFYEAEQNISQLLKWATGLAIFISCMGLLGLVIFTTSQRTKEIGVRKVLGASVPQIVGLLSRDFLWLVLIAFAIATPVAWYVMSRWLDDFAYRTTMSWWVFAASGAGLLMIALITLSIQTIRTASANPVLSLRSE